MFYKISQGASITSLLFVLNTTDGSKIRRIHDICYIHFLIQTLIRVRTRVIFLRSRLFSQNRIGARVQIAV
jgi:hypothetical protein